MRGDAQYANTVPIYQRKGKGRKGAKHRRWYTAVAVARREGKHASAKDETQHDKDVLKRYCSLDRISLGVDVSESVALPRSLSPGQVSHDREGAAGNVEAQGMYLGAHGR